MDMCKLFAKLTKKKSEDDTCDVFAKVLTEFFDEYRTFYGAMNEGGICDDIVDAEYIECIDKSTDYFEASVTLKYTWTPELIDQLIDYITSRIRGVAMISQVGENTAIITIEREG